MASLHLGDIAALALEYAAAHATKLTEGLAILRVLCVIEQPGTRTAFLARGLIDPTLAVATGHTYLLDDFPEWLLLDTCISVMEALMETGDVPAVASFFSRYAGASANGPMATDAIEPASIVHAAIRCGQVPVLEWTVATGKERGWGHLWQNTPWAVSASMDHVAVLDWAMAAGQNEEENKPTFSTREGDAIARAATEADCLQVLEWWWIYIACVPMPPTLPQPSPFDNIVNRALGTGNMQLIRWWWDKFTEYGTPNHTFGQKSAMISALASGSLEVVEWVMQSDAYRNQQGVLRWHLPPAWACARSLPLLQWWAANHLPPDQPFTWAPHYSIECAKVGAVDVLEWGDSLASTALCYRLQPVLQWYLEHRDTLPEQKTPTLFVIPAEGYTRGLHVMAWWETNVGFHDPTFLQLGAVIAWHCDRDWLEWWGSLLAKPARAHLVHKALTQTFVAARSAWALEMLVRVAATEFGLQLEQIMEGHTCILNASTIEAVCWWFHSLSV
ncbi:hypothetical protein BC828DRAFT_414044 [Blastocladiella britannica]|nr:hypothetical protein BC828DRAFT_414044 [Blastocladiella britannica]